MTRRDPHWYGLIFALVALTLAVTMLALILGAFVTQDTLWFALRLVSPCALAVYGIWILVDRYLWLVLRLIGLYGWPNLNGRWVGNSKFVHSAKLQDGAQPMSFDIHLDIKQTLTGIWITYSARRRAPDAGEVRSTAVGQLWRDESGREFELHYEFRTSAASLHPNTNGLTILDYRTGVPPRLVGKWIADIDAPACGTIEVELTKPSSLFSRLFGRVNADATSHPLA